MADFRAAGVMTTSRHNGDPSAGIAHILGRLGPYIPEGRAIVTKEPPSLQPAMPMKLIKSLTVLALLVTSFVAPSFAQIAWSNQSPSGLSDDIWSVTYANGTFAATTSQGKILTSSDGITWSTQVADQATWLVSIAYGNGKWVAVGAGGTILVSSDLKTWVNAKAVTSNKLNGVLYTGSVWVAVGDSATIVTSPDALNWTVQAAPAGITGFLHGIVLQSPNSPEPNVYICGALSGNGTGAIDSGVLLEMVGSPSTAGGQNYNVYSVGSGAGLVAGQGNVGNLEAIVAMTNSNQVVAVGWDSAITGVLGGGYLSSRVPNFVYRGLAYGNGYWVAAGEQGTILSSTDAQTWTQRFSGDSPSTLSTATFLGAAYSSTLQRFVIVGTGGTILISNAAPTVFVNVSTRGYVNSSVTGALLDGGFVVSGTAPRQVLIRADGPSLSAFGVTGALPDPVLTVYNSSGGQVATNTGWTTNTNVTAITTAALEVGAFALPANSKDSAILVTLAPGSYTVGITSAANNSGIVLFEAYSN